MTTAPVVPTSDSLHTLMPLGLEEVTITGGFWGRRQEVNASGIIPHCLVWEERIGWIDNFVLAARGEIAGRHAGLWFADSDVYKLIEAMAWEVGRTGSASLEAEIQRLGELIESVQEPDGYLNTRFGRPGTEPRYSDFAMGHELYCSGHLIQAAVARLRTGHDRNDVVVRTAVRNADHVCREFGPQGTVAVCGHPEIEVALVELFRATGERRYLEQAQLFVDRRGRGLLGDIEWGREYFQDEEPVRTATVGRGHAVRALYLMAGAVDAAVERGDDELLQAVRAQYDRTVARRTYLTGGMGSRHEGEAFGEDFELPPDRSYCETCAGVASVMVAWRLLLATGDPAYADIVERTLYNVVAASPAADGRSFFYANPLQVRAPGSASSPDEVSARSSSSLRAAWFEVSCCPTNIARTLASLSALCVTRVGDHIQIHQYADLTVRTTAEGGTLALSLRTDYPEDGRVVLRVEQAPSTPVSLSLRVPGWAQGGAALDGAAVDGPWAMISGVLEPGREFVLDLPLAPRFTAADPRIDAVRGCVAVERGPVVLCAESVDLPGSTGLDGVQVMVDQPPRQAPDGGVRVPARRLVASEPAWAYRPAEESTGVAEEFELPLIAYHDWGNRGPAAMRVWLPVAGAAGS